MINIKKLTLIVLFLLPIYICSFNNKTTFFSKNIIVHLKDKNLYLDLNDYIFGVVSAEMPALFNDEALKAQAVAARSFACSKLTKNIIEISSSINDQVYLSNYELKDKWQENYNFYKNKITRLVNETNNEVIKRNNIILKTYYFSMSNGFTENSNTVFNENTFNSVESPFEKELNKFEVITIFDENKLLHLLNIPAIDNFELFYNDTNHVDKVTVMNKTFTGLEFRKKLGLRSTDFIIKKDNNNYLITTKGYGHGVGMSQYGANEMAKKGFNYKEILMHYYQKTNIDKI